MNENKTNINWYPGHMAKTKRQISEMTKNIDIVLEVIDARIPYSSRVKDISEFTNNKRSIIVMTKYDLCDKSITDKWKKEYSKNSKVVSVNLKDNNDYKKVLSLIKEEMNDINEKRKAKGLLPKKAKVLVVGVPNVGKSTLINKIANKKRVEVGNKPGVTKHLSWIKVNDDIDLLDSPGVLVPKIEEEEVALNLASMTSIKEDILPIEKVAFHILNILNNDYKSILKENYNLNTFDLDDIENVYSTISNYRNIPLINGEIDYDRINILIVNDMKSEKIKGVTFDKM